MNDEFNVTPEGGPQPRDEKLSGENEPVYTPVDPVWRSQGAAPGADASKEEAKPRKKERQGIRPCAIIALCLVCSLLAGILGAAGAYLTMRNGNSLLGSVVDEIVPTAPPVLTTNASSVGAVDETAAYVYDLACQQVVGIATEITYYNIFGQVSAAVAGSGFVIDEDGYILTNYHVVETAYEGDYDVSVVMYDGTEYSAEIVGFDEDTDLAVLKIDASGLTPAELGDSETLTVGQVVYTVGNPLGELSYTMTSGIVSARDRAITTEANVTVNMFQIDAAVNEGNSGGPVYNSQGQVIGIVTAKYASTGVEGLGFAIPISDAVHVVNQILKYGYVTDKASLGVQVRSVTEQIAEYYNMVEGAYVNTVEEGSAAEKAGLEIGDIVTAVDGMEISSSSDLISAVKNYRAGDEAMFTVWRDGEAVELTVVFDEKLPEEQESGEETGNGGSPEVESRPGEYSMDSGDMEEFLYRFFGYGR